MAFFQFPETPTEIPTITNSAEDEQKLTPDRFVNGVCDKYVVTGGKLEEGSANISNLRVRGDNGRPAKLTMINVDAQLIARRLADGSMGSTLLAHPNANGANATACELLDSRIESQIAEHISDSSAVLLHNTTFKEPPEQNPGFPWRPTVSLIPNRFMRVEDQDGKKLDLVTFLGRSLSIKRVDYTVSVADVRELTVEKLNRAGVTHKEGERYFIVYTTRFINRLTISV